jgi:hypothetical protein
MNFTIKNEHLYILRVQGRFFSYCPIKIHAPTNNSYDETKNFLYEELERTYNACPGNDLNIVMKYANAKIGRETPTDDWHIQHA